MCRKALYPEISSRCSLFLRTSAACSSCKDGRNDTRLTQPALVINIFLLHTGFASDIKKETSFPSKTPQGEGATLARCEESSVGAWR